MIFASNTDEIRGVSIVKYIAVICHYHFRRTFRCDFVNTDTCVNKANLRDLIAATGLVILLKFGPNHRFFSLCDLEI